MAETPASSVPDLTSEGAAVPPAAEPALSSEAAPAPAPESAIDAAALDGPGPGAVAEAAPADGEPLLSPEPEAVVPPGSDTPPVSPAQEAPLPPPPVPAVAVTVVEAIDPGEPRVAATLEVAPRTSGEGGPAAGAEGGEWELLLAKVKAWLEQADLPGQWERLGGPLRGLGVLLGLLLVLKLYVALLDTLDDLPLLPRLLQLVGLIAFLRFGVTRLTRSSDRNVILDDWKRRWDAFRGA
jgi:hypothetical protein